MSDGSVVTVGSFDGLHLGHRAVVGEVLERAARSGLAAGLVTFSPHPTAVLSPATAPRRLSTGCERLEQLAELGLDWARVLRFDAALASLGAEQFVTEILLRRCGMRELVIGADHGFGQGRTADRQTLPELGRKLGFGVTIAAPVADALGQVISSTGIRAALAEGTLARAAEWLGRPYRMSGRVVRGAGRGRRIGMPTINLDGPPAEKLLPPDGVYAVRVEWGGGTAGGMMNQGPRPTVGDAHRSIEAHLFGLDQDLYGRLVRIEWVHRLRDIQKFSSLDALRAQLALDREQALAVLAHSPETSTARPIGAR
jgi:riboflavin kinase/FMN adenylyltransferase